MPTSQSGGGLPAAAADGIRQSKHEGGHPCSMRSWRRRQRLQLRKRHGEAWHWEDHGSERRITVEREDRPFACSEPIPDWQEVSTCDNGGSGLLLRDTPSAASSAPITGFMSKNAQRSSRNARRERWRSKSRRREQRRHEQHLLQRLEGREDRQPEGRMPRTFRARRRRWLDGKSAVGTRGRGTGARRCKAGKELARVHPRREEKLG